MTKFHILHEGLETKGEKQVELTSVNEVIDQITIENCSKRHQNNCREVFMTRRDMLNRFSLAAQKYPNNEPALAQTNMVINSGTSEMF